GEAVVDRDHHAGTGAGLGQVQSKRQAVVVVAEVDLDATGLAVDVDRCADRDTSRVTVEWVMAAAYAQRAARQRSDRLGHAPLGVIEPFVDELLERLPAVAVGQLLQPALPDPDRPNRGEVVPVPHLWNPDPRAAHPHDVFDVLVVALDPDARED